MAYRLEVYRFGKWEERGSYPSVMEAQSRAPRGQYRIVEDVPPVELTFVQQITVASEASVEKIGYAIERAVENTIEAITPKKRTQRKTSAKTSKPKAAGSKKRGKRTSS